MDDLNFYDADDQKKLRDQQKDAQQIKRRDLDDVRWVLSTPKGRRFIWKIWNLCGAFSASYVAKDATQTAFNEGKRDIGLALLLALYEADPLAHSRMVTEFHSEILKKRNKENDQ